MYYQAFGRRAVSMGMLPAYGCRNMNHPQLFPAGLGWPCGDGGSVGVSAAASGVTLWSCMLFYNLEGTDNAVVIHRDGGSRFHPRDRYILARAHCASHTSRPVDMTELAWCIHLNYPRVIDVYPPPTEGKGRRLRGVVVLQGSLHASLHEDAAFDSEGGGIIFDFFHITSSIGDSAESDPMRIAFNCICSVPSASRTQQIQPGRN